jgi:hypothetical protein
MNQLNRTPIATIVRNLSLAITIGLITWLNIFVNTTINKTEALALELKQIKTMESSRQIAEAFRMYHNGETKRYFIGNDGKGNCEFMKIDPKAKKIDDWQVIDCMHYSGEKDDPK